MIVPAATATPPQALKLRQDDLDRWDTFFENSRFAKQWAQHDGTNRQVVPMPVQIAHPSTMDPFVETIKFASEIAVGKEIILFVGHGADGGKPQTRGDPRVVSTAFFDSMPELGPAHEHTARIDQFVLQWTPPQKGTVTVIEQDDATPKIRHDGLVAAGVLMKSKGVTRFTVLSCNVGKDRDGPHLPWVLVGADFANALARILTVPVRLYRRKVVTREAAEAGGLVHVWLTDSRETLARDEPHSKDPDSPEFHELPNTDIVLGSP
jgi:hypothetical protein